MPVSTGPTLCYALWANILHSKREIDVIWLRAMELVVRDGVSRFATGDERHWEDNFAV